MSGKGLRALIAAIFACHGLGHVMGMLPALGLVKANAASQGWLAGVLRHTWVLIDFLGGSASRVACLLFYLVALLGFVGAALALQGWILRGGGWRTLALASAFISLLALGFCWNAVAFLLPYKLMALSVNVVILGCLLVQGWPTEADLGFRGAQE